MNGNTAWHAGNDGAGSGLDADLLDGQHAGNGSGNVPLSNGTVNTNLNADLLDGQHAGAFASSSHTHDGTYWKQGGNSFGAVGILGTNDNNALELKVKNQRVLRLEPANSSPNLIGGFVWNTVTAGVNGATIGGGGSSPTPFGPDWLNYVTDDFGTVGGGQGNTAGDAAGFTNDRTHATVGGGYLNNASGTGATVPGGWNNIASGAYSLAAGRRAQANNDGCFVWGDSTDNDVACSTNNRWVAHASGGVYFYTNSSLTSGVYVASGGGSWSSVSDRNLKANVQPVDGRAVLEQVAGLPISTWNYRSQDPAIRHMGPMAQDFAAAFRVGEDDTHITTVDADGVALAAIQGLYAENQALKAENANQQAQITTIQQQITALEARLSALENGPARPPDRRSKGTGHEQAYRTSRARGVARHVDRGRQGQRRQRPGRGIVHR